MSIGFRQDGQIKVSLQEYKSKLDKDLTLRTSQQETLQTTVRRRHPSYGTIPFTGPDCRSVFT